MNKDLKIALTLIQTGYLTNQEYYSQYGPVYMFATENTTGITQTISFKNKKILTVCSSGDQILNMLLYGASDIDTFDLNIFTKYFFHLKKAAIKALNYKEFIEFFFPNLFLKKNKVFSKETYQKISNHINDKEAKYFWDQIFSKYNGATLYNSALFSKDQYSKNVHIFCNPYLQNETNYQKLQKKLTNYSFKFYPLNILNDLLPTTKKYDYIYLSNILDYLICDTELNYAKKVKEIVSNLKTNLTKTGTLIVSYLYCYLDEYWLENKNGKLKSYSMRNKHFNDDYICVDFNGMAGLKSKQKRNKDALLLYKRK